MGVVFALLLHLGIAVTPPPNNIGAFSVIMAASRLPAFAQAADGITEATSLPRSLAGLAGLRRVFAVALVVVTARASDSGGHRCSAAAEGDAGQMSIMFFGGLDWSVPTLVLMIGALLRGLVHDLRFPPTTSKGAAATGAPRKATLAAHFAGPVVTAAEGYTNDGIYSSLFGPCLVLLAWLHAFVGPIAGSGSRIIKHVRQPADARR